MPPVLLGIAAMVLAAGGIVATVVLWGWATLGARLALVVLDVALALFVVVALVCIALNLVEREPHDRYQPEHQPQSQPQPQPWNVQLRMARQLASELEATLVRRRDGSYYLRIGPVQGRIPFQYGVAQPGGYDYDTIETATYSWLSMLADSLDAELLYDGKQLEWFLRWSNIQEVEEQRMY